MTGKRQSETGKRQCEYSGLGTSSTPISSNFFQVFFVVRGMALSLKSFPLMGRQSRLISLIFSRCVQNIFESTIRSVHTYSRASDVPPEGEQLLFITIEKFRLRFG